MPWREFYAPWRWTLLFWAWGAAYTIVTNRHIGLDIGRFGGVAEQVPALKSGTVVRVLWTKTMGMVVVLDVGAGRFHAYCHLSGDKLPARGQWIAQGARVGRLARGPASVSTSHIEFPGTAWGGIHLHLVETNHPDAAYSFPRIKGSEFYNPADTIKALLAAPADSGNARPFEPEEDMSQEDVDYLRRAVDNLSNVIGGISNAIADPNIGILKNASTAAGKSTDALAVVQNVEGIIAGMSNAIADPRIGILVASNDARAAATASLDALGKLSKGESQIDVAALADQIRGQLGSAVVDELVKRLAG